MYICMSLEFNGIYNFTTDKLLKYIYIYTIRFRDLNIIVYT